MFLAQLDEVQPPERNDPTHVRSRDAQCLKPGLTRRGRWLACRLRCGASRCIEYFSCFEHAVHNDRELSGDGHRGALEAQALTQLKSPALEAAFVTGSGSREDHRCCFIKQAPQTVVASSRDMAVIVDLA